VFLLNDDQRKGGGIRRARVCSEETEAFVWRRAIMAMDFAETYLISNTTMARPYSSSPAYLSCFHSTHIVLLT
jgi:hypothetical protein